MARERIHRVEQHRTRLAGTEAMTLVTDHHFPRHSHDAFGIGVLARGAQRSWSGVGPVEAGPGDVIMVNPGEVHDGAPIGEGARAWRIVYLDPAAMAGALEPDHARPLEIARPVAADPLLAAGVARLFAALTHGDALDEEEGLLHVVLRAARAHAAAPPKVGTTPPVRRALARIEEAPERAVTLAELAACAGTSRFQLLRGFAREVGLTPAAYLRQRRAGLARRLLAQGRTPAQAALEAGFADQSHLTRVFARQFGITPGRYRAALA
jgi:AraC-like DNA-binding protein/quercetin dioxygenase-like cupin family protein